MGRREEGRCKGEESSGGVIFTPLCIVSLSTQILYYDISKVARTTGDLFRCFAFRSIWA